MRRINRQAFTLIELLVSISIIAILLSIMLPALSQVRKMGERTVCYSNQRQCAMVCHMYAGDNADWLPQGNIHPDEDTPEFWNETNFASCQSISDKYDIGQEQAICGDWNKKIDEFFYEPEKADDGFYLGGTSIGFIYFARRYDKPDTPLSPVMENGKTYRSISKSSDGRSRISSPTLLACYHWDTISTGGEWGAKFPHLKSGSAKFIDAGEGTLPEIEGLAIGMLDTSVQWVKWDKLSWFEQNDNVRMYYGAW